MYFWKNTGSRLVVAVQQGFFRKCFGLICKLAVKFRLRLPRGGFGYRGAGKNGGFSSPPPPPPLAAGGCEASAATAALGEPRGTLYCTLLHLLPSRCIPVRFRLCERRSHAYRGCFAAPCAPHPGPSTLPAMALRRDLAEWKVWSGPGSLFR